MSVKKTPNENKSRKKTTKNLLQKKKNNQMKRRSKWVIFIGLWKEEASEQMKIKVYVLWVFVVTEYYSS